MCLFTVPLTDDNKKCPKIAKFKYEYEYNSKNRFVCNDNKKDFLRARKKGKCSEYESVKCRLDVQLF